MPVANHTDIRGRAPHINDQGGGLSGCTAETGRGCWPAGHSNRGPPDRCVQPRPFAVPADNGHRAIQARIEHGNLDRGKKADHQGHKFSMQTGSGGPGPHARIIADLMGTKDRLRVNHGNGLFSHQLMGRIFDGHAATDRIAVHLVLEAVDRINQALNVQGLIFFPGDFMAAFKKNISGDGELEMTNIAEDQQTHSGASIFNYGIGGQGRGNGKSDNVFRGNIRSKQFFQHPTNTDPQVMMGSRLLGRMHHFQGGIIKEDPVGAGASGIYADAVASDVFSYQLAHLFETNQK